VAAWPVWQPGGENLPQTASIVDYAARHGVTRGLQAAAGVGFSWVTLYGIGFAAVGVHRTT